MSTYKAYSASAQYIESQKHGVLIFLAVSEESEFRGKGDFDLADEDIDYIQAVVDFWADKGIEIVPAYGWSQTVFLNEPKKEQVRTVETRLVAVLRSEKRDLRTHQALLKQEHEDHPLHQMELELVH